MILSQSETDRQLADVGDRLLGASWEQWLTAGIVLAVAIVVGRVLRTVVERLVRRGDTPTLGARLVARIVMYAVLVFGFVYALSALDIPLAPLFGALGLAGIALAFALQDVLGNFMAGLILMVRRPFEVGDQIETVDHEGVVEDIRLRAVRLRTFDGTTVYIPNASVLDNPIVNYTERGARRTTFDIGVSYDTDLDEAQQVIVDTVRSIDGVHGDPAPEAYVHAMADSSINFAVRYWHEPQIARLWQVRDEVARALKRRFDSAGIEIPFPQRMLHLGSADAPIAVTSANGSHDLRSP